MRHQPAKSPWGAVGVNGGTDGAAHMGMAWLAVWASNLAPVCDRSSADWPSVPAPRHGIRSARPASNLAPVGDRSSADWCVDPGTSRPIHHRSDTPTAHARRCRGGDQFVLFTMFKSSMSYIVCGSRAARGESGIRYQGSDRPPTPPRRLLIHSNRREA